MRLAAVAVLAALALAFSAAPARAAESYDGCTGTIAALPATINTPGTWCLKTNLATNIASGIALTIATHNVTLDCNGFRIGGFAAGSATLAFGVVAENRVNTTIRDCNIRGFRTGVLLATGSGDIVEDNRIEGNTQYGLQITSTDTVIRRNMVLDTGASFYSGQATAIFVQNGVHVLDNIVAGVFASGGNNVAYGIRTHANGSGSVVGNDISGLLKSGNGTIYGIHNFLSGRLIVMNNRLRTDTGDGLGILCDQGSASVAATNVVSGFATNIQYCLETANIVVPGPV